MYTLKPRTPPATHTHTHTPQQTLASSCACSSSTTSVYDEWIPNFPCHLMPARFSSLAMHQIKHPDAMGLLIADLFITLRPRTNLEHRLKRQTLPWAAEWPSAPKTLRLWLTYAGDLLSNQVLQQGVDDRVVSGVQLVSVNPNVEAEPVGVRFCCQLPCRAELIQGPFSIPGWANQKGGAVGCKVITEH